ncbi:MAG: T9SS type A sorting domain-containing protein [Bacteroidota bacterium]
MKKPLFILLLLSIGLGAIAQYNIGHTTITFNDPSRSRDIQTEIYYPANTAGNNVQISNGTFPTIIFGHGFVMAWDSYDNFWEELVPQGYIMLYPRTEGSMSPSHDAFALDLAFLVSAIQDENLNVSSIFYGAVDQECAIMGHSMGGGCSVLAAATNPGITTLVNFAAAETNTSAIAAAASVTVPALIFAGSVDCVAPPADHQIPIYNAIGSDCKTLVSITGGGHCYFANYNFNCTFGESTCMPVIPISREEQHAAIFSALNPWLDFILKGNGAAFNTFNDTLVASTRITYQQTCNITMQNEVSSQAVNIYPNPANDFILIESDREISSVEIYNTSGNMVKASAESRISLSGMTEGIYCVKITAGKVVFSRRILVMP